MNDDLFCSLHLDAGLAEADLLALAAELTGGAIRDGGVDLVWGRVISDDDYGDFRIAARDPDDSSAGALCSRSCPATTPRAVG
jgi:hypothetical protein